MTGTTKADRREAKVMTVKEFNWTVLASFGLVLFCAVHGLVIWGGLNWSGQIGGSWRWVAAGALMAFSLYHLSQHMRGTGHSFSRPFGGHAHDGEEVKRRPHDGFLVNLGHGFIEITISEIDVPPRFRLFFHDKHQQPRKVASLSMSRFTVQDLVRSPYTWQANLCQGPKHSRNGRTCNGNESEPPPLSSAPDSKIAGDCGRFRRPLPAHCGAWLDHLL